MRKLRLSGMPAKIRVFLVRLVVMTLMAPARHRVYGRRASMARPRAHLRIRCTLLSGVYHEKGKLASDGVS
jgi:hypothetical protein